MERKIGKISKINGEWFQLVKADNNNSCNGCSFFNPKNKDCCVLKCSNYGMIYKKLEKIGKPVTVKGRTFQKLTSDNVSCKECVFNIPNKACCKDNYIDGICYDGFWIELKQNKEDMEEHHSTENYPTKEEKIAERIANKVGENISQQLRENLNKEDMEETKSAAEIINKINHGIEPMSSCRKDTEEKILGELLYKYIDGKITYDAFEKGVIELCDNKGESKPTLKDFDLEAAKAGKPVYTRDGRKARIICFDAKKNISPIIALIEDNGMEIAYHFDREGKNACKKSELDLMMLSEKKEGWMNVYKSSTWATKEEAMKYRNSENDYIGTIKIEWTE